MSNEIVSTEKQWTPDQVALIKRTICKDATDDELKLFIHVSQKTGLDPFARQIYAVKRPVKNGPPQMVIQTGIDGYRVTAERTGNYAGSDDPVYDNETEPNKATVTVYKIVHGVRCAFTASARWNEYCPKEGQDFMWRKMPCVMLGKVAEALALRKAFPADLSGIYVKEEMDQADYNPHAAKNNQPPPEDGIQAPLPKCVCGSEFKFSAKKSSRYPDGCWYCPNFKDASIKHDEPYQPEEYQKYKKEILQYTLDKKNEEE